VGPGLPLTTNPINFSAMLENGLSANAWGVRVEKPGNIYIYCRDHMNELKISLHESGMQFAAFTKQSGIKMTGNSRMWHRWREPEHHDDSSLVPTFNLLLPSWGLVLSQETRDANRRVWDDNHIFIAATEGPIATTVSFVIKNSDVNLTPGPSEDLPFLPIGVLDARPGKKLWLCVQYRDEGNMKEYAREIVAHANGDAEMTAALERPPTGETFGFCAGGFDSAGVAYLLPFPAQVEKDESGKLSTIAPRFGD
jgi:hypothetical protein